MKKRLKPIFIFLTSIATMFILYMSNAIWTHATGPLSESRLPETEKMAINATVEHFKKEKNLDVVVTNTGFSGEFMGSDFYIEGHAKDDENKKFSATVDCDDYSVEVDPKNEFNGMCH
ncbi:hypothetical protein [Clostridium sp.]|uniref:hypothetical protein n=1 Tax=Clostridium sp. TaxID=1506 RepID=UPI003464E8AC